MTTTPTLSIIIVNYRGWKPLGRLLAALESIDKADLSLETIVVDNCSNDGKWEAFTQEFTRPKFIKNSGNHGFAHGCNTGAKNATSPLLLFLNPDTLPTIEALNELVTAYHKSDFAILSCRQSLKGNYKPLIFPKLSTLTGLQRSVYRLLNKEEIAAKSCDENGIARPDFVIGSIVMVSRVWYDKIGGWDERFWMYSEDDDFSKRVSDSGGKIGFLCNTYIEHVHGGTSRINVETEALTKTEVMISKHVYVAKHFTAITALISHKLLIINNLLSALFLGILGIPLFFIPKARVQTLIMVRLISYYVKAIARGTWRSERSILG
ncbi:MAG: glycosyltransferase family 2 protein [Spirosomaceae bacterium]|nr:glycosyltransferase family 2 protein [Spirosomataceae bacterium]